MTIRYDGTVLINDRIPQEEAVKEFFKLFTGMFKTRICELEKELALLKNGTLPSN